MKDKARSNLRASKLLIRERLLDPAMSRLYYALFQAGVHAMTMKGQRPERLSRDASPGRWSHALLKQNASLCRNVRGDRLLFELASSLRARADYEDVPVEEEELTPLLVPIEQFVEEVCS